MAKDYWLAFGSDPRSNTGLSPTFVVFQTSGGTGLAAPAITEPGVSSGFYYFTYGPTASIVFLVDGGSGLSSSDRFINGVLDPLQVVDQRIGSTSDSYGSTSVDPSSVFGYLKRNQEISEGNATFNKSTGVWDMYSRGSTTLLREKTLSNTTTQVGKT